MAVRKINPAYPRDPFQGMEPGAVGLPEAARLLGVSQHTARKYVRQQAIPSVRIGRRVLIPMQTINDLALTGTQ